MTMKKLNLTGQKFGMLEVIKEAGRSREGLIIWECKCDCGEIVYKKSTDLIRGRCKSCGCLRTIRGIEKRKSNNYDLSGEYGIGWTNKGEPFYFDLEDYEKIKGYCWYTDSLGYLICSRRINGKKTNIRMHRLVLNFVPSYDGEIVDHINGKTNDNRKQNLRVCDIEQNSLNHDYHNPKVYTNTAKVMGVSPVKNKGEIVAWKSRITYKGVSHYLGYYKIKEEAVKARLEAEKKYFGKFRRIKDE